MRTAITNTLLEAGVEHSEYQQVSSKQEAITIIDSDMKKFYEKWAPKISKQRDSLSRLAGAESNMAGSFTGALEPLIRFSKG